MGRTNHAHRCARVPGQQLERSDRHLVIGDSQHPFQHAARMEHQLRSGPVGLRRLLAGAAILMAALQSCADKKVDKAMTEEKRSWGELAGGCRVNIAWMTSPTGIE